MIRTTVVVIVIVIVIVVVCVDPFPGRWAAMAAPGLSRASFVCSVLVVSMLLQKRQYVLLLPDMDSSDCS